ncbi:hypothetical protein HYU13_06515 [Candidatus Woesearchaeota archaeon]|nr:hypothetical protein [Candidatus Woesearchaeota archaeon]
MSRRNSIGQRMTTSLSMEQSLEMRQVLIQQSLAYIPEEFRQFITFEGDDDTELLEASLPFLFLHEASHPAQAKGKLYVPEASAALSDDQAKHNANEVGIDKGSYLLGTAFCGLSPDDMYGSHAAITQRVFRDMLELQKIKTCPSMLARLEAELREHGEGTSDGGIRELIRELLNTVETPWRGKGNPSDYQTLVSQYRDIYRKTSLKTGTAIMASPIERFLFPVA